MRTSNGRPRSAKPKEGMRPFAYPQSCLPDEKISEAMKKKGRRSSERKVPRNAKREKDGRLPRPSRRNDAERDAALSRGRQPRVGK